MLLGSAVEDYSPHVIFLLVEIKNQSQGEGMDQQIGQTVAHKKSEFSSLHDMVMTIRTPLTDSWKVITSRCYQMLKVKIQASNAAIQL